MALFYSIMWEYTITFFAVFVTDVIYIHLVKSIQTDRPWAASFWATTVTFTASIAVINYTTDHLAIIPALLGAFFGTFLGMRLRKKEQVNTV